MQMEESKIAKKVEEEEYPEAEAFSVKIVCEDKAVKRLAKQQKLDNIFLNWEAKSQECQFEVGRLMFQKFEPEIYSVISKKHCVVYAKRTAKKVTKKKINEQP